MKYKQFIFKDWRFDVSEKTLVLKYSYDNTLNFEEKYKFDFEFTAYDSNVLERTINNLFFVAGVSYFKAYLPPEIKIEKGFLDKAHAEFFSRTYQKGLGEFFYTNSLDPKTQIIFPVNSESSTALNHSGEGLMVGVGGGKDALVSVEMLSNEKITTWSVGHREKLEPLVKEMDTDHLWIERQWDSKLQELNDTGAFNGHVPISAILACVGSVAAVLSGNRDIVVSNEASADEESLVYKDVSINHQYSKSSAYEKDFQAILNLDFGTSLRYYSFLRPFSELYIADLFAKLGFEKYRYVFKSCNKAFRQGQSEFAWCGQCPKCAFVFLILTPFISRPNLEEVFGKNLLLDQKLELVFRQLLGIEGDKPLECVGEVQESRAAMNIAKTEYPELKKYEFVLDESYDYRHLRKHSMPPEIFNIISESLEQ